MRFKEWLINEQEGDDGSGEEGVTWDLLYPTKASDYVNAVKNPRSHYFLQWRWNRGEELGRPLYNINNKNFRKEVTFQLNLPKCQVPLSVGNIKTTE